MTSTAIPCAYVSLPFLGEAWAERGGPTKGRAFIDLLGHAGGLTVFAGEWSVVLDSAWPSLLRPLWLAVVAPMLAASALLGVASKGRQVA